MEKTIKRPYSTEEMEALQTGCGTIRDRALVEFLYSTGVRVSKLASLNVGNRTGVKGVHPHRFRRTIATDLLGRGMPIEQVKEGF